MSWFISSITVRVRLPYHRVLLLKIWNLEEQSSKMCGLPIFFEIKFSTIYFLKAFPMVKFVFRYHFQLISNKPKFNSHWVDFQTVPAKLLVPHHAEDQNSPTIFKVLKWESKDSTFYLIFLLFLGTFPPRHFDTQVISRSSRDIFLDISSRFVLSSSDFPTFPETFIRHFFFFFFVIQGRGP